mgnify:CR=1 FL=1
MKHGIVVCIIILFMLVPVFSQDLSPWQIGANVQYIPSANIQYMTADAFALINGGFFSIGGGIKNYFGLDQACYFISPYVRAELGWFYMGGGPLFLVTQPEESGFATISGGVSFLAMLGAAIPIWKHDYGKLVINIGLDASMTPARTIIPESDNIIAAIFASIISTAVNSIFNIVKLTIGIGYYQYF